MSFGEFDVKEKLHFPVLFHNKIHYKSAQYQSHSKIPVIGGERELKSKIASRVYSPDTEWGDFSDLTLPFRYRSEGTSYHS